MKRKHTITLIAAALLAALLCGTALAAVTGFSLSDMFTKTDANGVTHVNEAAIRHIRAVDCRYESENLLYTVDECLYNSKEETLVLSATFTSKNPENRYSVLLEGMTAGGAPIMNREARNLTEFFLTDETVNSVCSAFVPGAAGREVTLRYAVLKLTGTLVSDEELQALRSLDLEKDWDVYKARLEELAAKGFVYIEPDGTIACASGLTDEDYADALATAVERLSLRLSAGDLLYADALSTTLELLRVNSCAEDERYANALVSTGYFELTDRFTVTFEAEDSAEDAETLAYTGPEAFEFDGVKMEILRAEVGESRATLAVRTTLTDETYRAWFGEGDSLAAWSLQAGGEMTLVSAIGESDGFTHNADGSWTITEEYIFGMLYGQPTEIPLILETVNPDGRVTTHDDMPITLTFARK